MQLHNSQATFARIDARVDAIAATAFAELHDACLSCAAVAR